MSLIIATGSNLKNKLENLEKAKLNLQKHFNLIFESEVFQSEAVDYTAQPDFYNQVLEFQIPSMGKDEVMKLLLRIELDMGRVRDFDKGPRTIDIDILFWGIEDYKSELLTLPHPRWSKRSFVVRPLQQLPFFKTLEKCFKIPHTFDVEAKPIK
jgi:2-amino-4-hydroxy-6-hydroxymethyldihydropteridine diphosphokinase